MDNKEYFKNNVLIELLDKTKFINNNLEDDCIKDKSKRFRCLSCDQLCEYYIYKITLINGKKYWDCNVRNVNNI